MARLKQLEIGKSTLVLSTYWTLALYTVGQVKGQSLEPQRTDRATDAIWFPKV
jgi:hypothetical protein